MRAGLLIFPDILTERPPGLKWLERNEPNAASRPVLALRGMALTWADVG
jgi:hypothetical protein